MSEDNHGKKMPASSSTGFVRMPNNNNSQPHYYNNYQQMPMGAGNPFSYPPVPAGYIIMPPTAANSRDFNQYNSPQGPIFSDEEEEGEYFYQSPNRFDENTSQHPLSDNNFYNNQFVDDRYEKDNEYQYPNFSAPQMGMLPFNNWGQPFPIPVPMPMTAISMNRKGMPIPPFIPNGMERPMNHYHSNDRGRHQKFPSFKKNKKDYNRKTFNRNSSYAIDDSFADKKISEFKGQLYELSIQQQGSRFIQTSLKKEDLPLVLEEILPHVVELSQHSFGNYLVQKLVELGSENEKLKILELLATSKSGIISIACDPHGTRTLQRVVSELMEFDDGVEALKDTFKGNIIPLSENLNGNHVIQELLASLQPKDIQFIFDEIYSSIEEVSVEKHGCCVLQRCIDNGDEDQISKLCELILKRTLNLSKDPFGNYVVQYILQMEKDRYFFLKHEGDKEISSKIEEIFHFSIQILKELSAHLKELCFHKFGSNVIENLMKIPCGLSAELFHKLLFLFENGGSDLILEFLTDPFANYVLQTSLLSSQKQSTKNDIFSTFVRLLKPVIETEIECSEKTTLANNLLPQQEHNDHMKMLQLQRVLTICNNDYLKNRDSTNYNSWGPNFNTKNHESFGLDKKRSRANTGKSLKLVSSKANDVNKPISSNK
ncbi:hypothetical protein QEN19_002162 [Hanseniaspora menglaensis]